MASKYGFFEYLLDVFRGNVPGPFGFLKAPDEKGPLGEYLIKYVLDSTIATTGYPMYSNLIVPNFESQVGTAEIDVLMLMREGIYVFESKNYSGWIFGSADDQQWTVSLSSNRKEHFYNPILQNRTHVKALAAYLGLSESVFHSYIVFSRRCELKKVPDNTEEYVVCRRPSLRKLIKRDMKKHENTFTWEEVRELNRKLGELNDASDEAARESHVAQIKAVQRMCPYCGKELVERHRKSDGGSFVGCSGYPKCRYIRNSW